MPEKNYNTLTKSEERAACALYKAATILCIFAFIIMLIALITGRSIWGICFLTFAGLGAYNYFRSQTSRNVNLRRLFAINAIGAILSIIFFFVFK